MQKYNTFDLGHCIPEVAFLTYFLLSSQKIAFLNSTLATFNGTLESLYKLYIFQAFEIEKIETQSFKRIFTLINFVKIQFQFCNRCCSNLIQGKIPLKSLRVLLGAYR